MAILLLPAFLLLSGCTSIVQQPDITEIGNLERLQPGVAAPVDIRAVITYSGREQTFAQDHTGAAELRAASAVTLPDPGRLVRISGFGEFNGRRKTITVTAIQDEGPATLPKPRALQWVTFGNPRYELMRATVEGTVEGAFPRRHSEILMEIRTAEGLLEVQIADSVAFDVASTLGDAVRLTGVIQTIADLHGIPVKRQLLLQRKADLSTLAEAQPFEQIPVTPIATLNASAKHGHRVRLRGRLEVSADRKFLNLTDGRDSVIVKPPPGTTPVIGSDVQVVGFVGSDGAQLAIRNALVLEAPASIASTEVIRTVQDIRSLPLGSAGAGLPVKIVGVVTYHDPRRYALFVQDASAGIYISCHGGPPPDIVAGDRVEVTGVTSAGDFAPIVRARSFRKLGRSALPPAREVSTEYL
ncbi:MAG TPA: hypothetical protein VEQ63_10130, partial [Bryobacteraceae bacterium]|nr:hypothetical protein [Bryobacteraceae bacterium]